MRKKHIGLILIMMCMLVFTACQSNKEEGKPSSNGDKTEKTENETTSNVLEYDYTEKVFNRSLTEGKMAVYFLRSDLVYNDYAGEQQGGESTLFITPDGKTMLVDTSCMYNSAYIVKALQDLEINKLDYLVITSMDDEYVGGYATIMRHMEIGEVLTYYPKHDDSANFGHFIRSVEEKNIPITYLYRGDVIDISEEVQAEVLNPYAGYEAWNEENGQENGSLLFRMTYKDASYLIGGKITETTEELLVKEYGDKLQADVVRIHAQGAEGTNSKDWIKVLNAKVAGGSGSMVGNEISFGRFTLYGGVALHTILDGTCVVYTSGDGVYEIQTEGTRVNENYTSLDTTDGYMKIE